MIKFSKPRDYLEKKLKTIPRYKTREEREVLLLEDNESLDTVLKILLNIKSLNDLETLAILIKAREISVSDLLSGMIECPNCKIVNDYNIDLSEVINLDPDFLMTTEENEKYPNFPIGLFNNVDEIINNREQDNIILKDINEIIKIMKRNNQNILNLLHTKICRSCKNEINIPINPKEILSRVSLVGLYDEYSGLTFHGKFSKIDIDDMYPFERELFINLTKKKLESSPNLGGLLGG